MAKKYLLKSGAKPHKLTREDSAKGGRARTTIKSLTRRIYCNAKCPLYPCWASYLSKEKFGGKCALKEFPKRIQQRTIDFMVNGEEGAIKQLVETLMYLSAKADKNSDMDSLSKYFDRLIAFTKVAFGEKKRLSFENKLPIEAVVKKLQKDLETDK